MQCIGICVPPIDDDMRSVVAPDLVAQIALSAPATREASVSDPSGVPADEERRRDMRRHRGPVVAMAPQVAATQAIEEILAALNGEPTPGGP
jgi:predicted methyltransferase